MKTKIIILSSLFSLSMAPKILYNASTSYLSFYSNSQAVINRKIDTLLNTFNLEQVKQKTTLINAVDDYASAYNLDPKFIHALIEHESSNNPDSFSPKGAIGLMQIMPANAKRCGLKKVSELWNEETNIKCGTQIIAEEIKTYKGDIYKALLAYNGGPKAVVSPVAESLNHAKEVLRIYARNSVRQ